jgi:hypothetical protein
VVAVVFQSTFRAEMHQNDVFFIFKKLFLRSAHQNNSKHTKKINFLQKKIKIFWARGLHRVPKRSLYC